MKFSEKNLDMLVNKLIGNPNINDKEKIILDRYYNSGDSFSKKLWILKTKLANLL